MPANKAMYHTELRFNPLLWGELLQELDIRLEQSFFVRTIVEKTS
ncbi:hypothetical protein [Paenibacillus sp. TY11]